MGKIIKITHPQAWELMQARIDESIVTGQPLVERPFWYDNLETGQMYYDLYGCVGWPTEVSDTDSGMPGYAGVVGVVKPKSAQPIQAAAFQLLTEAESEDVPELVDHMIRIRAEYGFGVHPGLMQAWFGDPERYITTLALMNERLIAAGGDRAAILIIPPDDFYEPKAFDNYVRSLRSSIMPSRVRFYFGGNDILKNKLREFKRDCPAVTAVGGLVHSLFGRTMWMDQSRESAFVLEENYDA
jgi:hypothetical protein